MRRNETREGVQSLQKHLQAELDAGQVLGVESTCPKYVLDAIENVGSSFEMVEIDDVMAGLRLVKSPAEIELMKKSTEIIETTLAELYDKIHLGMSRLELMQETKSMLYKNGATGISHLTFSFGKANPEIAIGEKLEEGHLITLDLGGIYKGYASDNRRYVYTGDIPDALLEHYNAMVEIIDATGDALVPGAKYSDIFKLAEAEFEKRGIVPILFNHTGHNIGLETEEEWLTDDPGKEVREGMVINIEMYSVAPTGDIIGDEETYIIGADGPTRISVLPREIRVVK